jgi:hypothetical protein
LAKRDLVGSLYALRRREGRGCYAPTPFVVVVCFTSLELT